MKYFVFESQREGTCYHEFYKGKWDGSTFWKSDSILLHDDYLYDNGFVDAIIEIVSTYDPFDETEISADEWNRIGKVVLSKNSEAQALYKEADKWLKNNVFNKYDCFTILGI